MQWDPSLAFPRTSRGRPREVTEFGTELTVNAESPRSPSFDHNKLEETNPEGKILRRVFSPSHSGEQKKQHDVANINPGKLHAWQRGSRGTASPDDQLDWRGEETVT